MSNITDQMLRRWQSHVKLLTISQIKFQLTWEDRMLPEYVSMLKTELKNKTTESDINQSTLYSNGDYNVKK